MLTITRAPTATRIVETVQTEPVGRRRSTIPRNIPRAGIGFEIDDGDAGDGRVAGVQPHGDARAAATVYDRLAIDAAHPRYFAPMINDDAPVQVELIEPPPPVPAAQKSPRSSGVYALANAADEDLGTPGGQRLHRRARHTPGDRRRQSRRNPRPHQQRPFSRPLIAHCEQMGDRFAVLDPQAGPGAVRLDSIEDAARRGWIRRADTQHCTTRGCACDRGRAPAMLVPPSGHVCGIMARSDNVTGAFTRRRPTRSSRAPSASSGR